MSTKFVGFSRLGNEQRTFELTMLARKLSFGCDIHQNFGVICVLQQKNGAEFGAVVREFANTGRGMAEAAQWARGQVKPEHQSEELVLLVESTGPYHKIVERVFTDNGFKVVVCNPTRVQALLKQEGKNDRKDSFTLARLALSFDIRGSIAVEGKRAELRELCRRRTKILQMRTTASNRIGGGLTFAGVPLAAQVPMLTKSGRAMLHAIFAGERDALTVTKLWKGARCDPAMAASTTVAAFERATRASELSDGKQQKFIKILDALQFLPELPKYVVEMAQAQYQVVELADTQLQAVEEQLETVLDAYEQPLIDGRVLTAREAIKLLQTAPMLSYMACVYLIAEVGVDLAETFGSAEALTRYLGLTSGAALSAGKVTGKSVTKGNSFVKPVLLQCAATFQRQCPAEDEKGRYLWLWMKSYQLRSNVFKARVAVSRKVISSVWWMFRKGEEYSDAQYKLHASKGVASIAKSLKSRAGQLGRVLDDAAERDLTDAYNAIATALGRKKMNRYVIVTPFVDAPVQNLDVSKRLLNVLDKAGITQVSQLCIKLMAGEKVAGVGEEGLKELETVLHGKYLEVHDDAD